MIISRLCACCMATLLLSSAASATAVPESGQNNRVEWKVQQSWITSGKALDMVNSLDGRFTFILTDKQQVQVYDNQGQLQGSIPVESGVSNIDISPQGELLYLVDNAKQTFSSVAVSFVVDIDIAGAPIKGPADAPVTMTLFTDFECPYCRQIVPLLEEVLEKNPKTVKLAFKNMPLRMHRFAEPAARAALAGHEQGKFWEFHDRLFALPKVNDEAIRNIATDLQLDMEKFERDMASPEIQAKIQKDIADGQNAGVSGTPTVFINGRPTKQRTLDSFQQIINEELEKKEKN